MWRKLLRFFLEILVDGLNRYMNSGKRKVHVITYEVPMKEGDMWVAHYKGEWAVGPTRRSAGMAVLKKKG